MKMMKIMKKNYIKIMAAAALALLSACSQENEIGGGSFEYGKNAIVFTMGTPSTKSAAELSDITEQGVTIPLGKDETGTSFYLEESVVDMNAPITRGTPAYTENVGTLYGSFAAKSELSGDSSVDVFENAEGTNKWSNSYTDNIWNKGNPLHFWMYMPTDMTSKGVSNLGYPEKKITFDYKSPSTAADQQDILFSYRELVKGTDQPDKGVAVLFHHALTGVKFRLGNTESNISIKSITFNNLITEGSCTVTPRQESTGYVDNIEEFSSGDGTTVVWDLGEEVRGDVSSGDYNGTVDFTSGSFGEDVGPYPASFNKNYNDKNLNSADGSQTFWLIPQTIDSNVELTISYTDAYGDHEWTVAFGSVLNGVEWKAGQIRTYTIKIDDVNVKIEDDVTIVEPTTETITDSAGNTFDAVSYNGSTKQNVAITNTGNTDVFIRAAIVGQWLDESGNPVFGFTDYTKGTILVASWYQDQFGENAEHKQGQFTGLPGTNWVEGNDGYYYYTEPVAPGKIIGNAPEDAENDDDYLGNPLFTEYTVGTPPAAQVAGAVKNVYFRLEIATQAISAKQLDGSNYSSYTEAWSKANSIGNSDDES
ncbi:MAG: hypothetical protein IJK48_05680 [Bacteroidales bacterium]|nr:hypothetical protein [Bacteroidales bacterium]